MARRSSGSLGACGGVAAEIGAPPLSARPSPGRGPYRLEASDNDSANLIRSIPRHPYAKSGGVSVNVPSRQYTQTTFQNFLYKYFCYTVAIHYMPYLISSGSICQMGA